MLVVAAKPTPHPSPKSRDSVNAIINCCRSLAAVALLEDLVSLLFLRSRETKIRIKMIQFMM